MRIFSLAVLFCTALSTSSRAQTAAGSIKGLLKDSLNKQNLSLATVTVFHAKDTSIITYRLSDGNGEFKVPGLPLNEKLRVIISFSGYRIYRKEFELTSYGPAFDLGTILMVNDPKSLDEVLIYAERPPVSIRKDTIEFNASAFKTLPSALLEDLLKKLPGIDIDLDGNIQVKGKKVNRLLVDGKEFFGGDPKIATKNLPSNIVDKVQVMDDKEQLERDPDVAAADLGQVINIKLKRAIKEGWFGKAYGGVGTNQRHETGLIVNAFRDTTQISFLGYSNNINKQGFGITDLQKIGGFNRGGGSMEMTMIDATGAVSSGFTGFGGFGQGIQHSFGGGTNFNHQQGKKLTINLQYFYGQVNNNFESLSNRERFFGDVTQVIRSSSTSLSKDRNNRVGGSVIWKMDSFTTVTFRPGVTFNKTSAERKSNTLISDNKVGNLNGEENMQTSMTDRNNYSHNLFLSRNFRKRGRIFTLNQNFSNNSSLNDQYFDIFSQYYIGATTFNSHQLRQRETWDKTISFNASFTEPVSKAVSLRLQHNADWTGSNNYMRPYNQSTSTGKYTELIDSINSGIERKVRRNTSTAGITWRKDKLTLTGAVNLHWLSYDNDYLKTEGVSRSYFYIYPNINLRWKDFGLNYSSNVNPPSSYDLQPVIDNTNRQFIFIGNPDLKPGTSQYVSLSYFKFSPKGNSLSINVSVNQRKNSVIRESVVNSLGIQTSRPVNVDGLKNLNLFSTYTKQVNFNKTFKLSIRPNMSVGYSENIVSFNGVRGNSINRYGNGTLNILFNYQDKIELNNRYTINLNQTRYDNSQKFYRNIETVMHTAESEIVVRYPRHFVWENVVNYIHNPNVAPGIRKDAVRWNAGVNYLFLKDDKGQLKLSVFDLLNQNVNVNRFTSDNSIIDSQTTTLRQFFMLSFIYNIRTVIPQKIGGRDRSFFLF